MKVLLVEDDALVRLFAAEALTDEGFQVVEAASGDEALKACAEGAPDVLFTEHSAARHAHGLGHR